MAPRTPTVLLAGLLVLSGLSVAGGHVVDAPPSLTVENNANTTHRVVVYTFPQSGAPMQLNFAVTTADGDRRLATLEQLYWPGEFHNVTLADEGVPSEQFTVEPGGTERRRVDSWSPGDVTVYLVEDFDGSHVGTDIVTCTGREQKHDLTIQDNGAAAGFVCASSFDPWLA